MVRLSPRYAYCLSTILTAVFRPIFCGVYPRASAGFSFPFALRSFSALEMVKLNYMSRCRALASTARVMKSIVENPLYLI